MESSNEYGKDRIDYRIDLTEIELQLSLLPQYLTYRCDYLISGFEAKKRIDIMFDTFNKLGYFIYDGLADKRKDIYECGLYFKLFPKGILSFDEWFERYQAFSKMVITGSVMYNPSTFIDEDIHSKYLFKSDISSPNFWINKNVPIVNNKL